MKKYTVVIDVAKCENCNNCFLSCKDEHCGNVWPGYTLSQPQHGQRWMNILRKERGEFPLVDVAYLPKPCMHCDEAPCIKAAKYGAVYKREDGIVLIDPEKAKDQKQLVDACPYNVIWWNEKEQVPQKCTLCAHLLDQGWKAPRCAQACPTGAISFLHLEEKEITQLLSSENLKPLDSRGKNFQPRIYYKNLHLFNTCMITGSIATTVDGLTECAAGARVTLYREGKNLSEQSTDEFGDFKFDGLEEGSTGYEIEVLYAGAKASRKVGILHESHVLDTIWI